MNEPGAQETSLPDNAITDIWEVRSQLANKGLVFYSFAVLPSVGASISRAFEIGWHPIYLYHLVLAIITIVLALLRKHLPYAVRAGWLISLSFVVGAVGLYVFGPLSGSTIALAVFPVTAAVALGLRAGLIASGITLFVVLLVAVAFLTGRLEYSYDMVAYLNSPTTWSTYLVNFILWVPTVVIAVGVVYRNLVNSFELVQKNQGFRKRLFESSKVPTLVMEVDTYAFVDCNSAAASIFGFSSPAELIGKTPIDVSTPFQSDGRSSADGVRSYVSKAVLEGDIQFEWQHERVDGTPWDAEAHLMYFKADGVDLLQCTVTDVTRRKSAEEASRQSQKRYQSLFNHAGDAIFLLKEGQFVECNPKTLEMFGASEKDVIGSTPQRFSPETQPDGRLSNELAEEKVSLALQGKAQFFSWLHSRMDGTLFDAEVTLNHLAFEDGDYLLAIVRDVTKRRQTEAKMQLYALIIEQAAEIVIITDVEGTITYVNPAFESITGYSRDEAVGKNPRILKSGQTADSIYRELWDTIQGGKTWKGRFVNKKKDGTLFTEDSTISPLRDQSGNIVSFVSVKRDVSHEIALGNRIRQAQKMEAMGALAGGIAHDFNNILSAIFGYTELAILDVDEGSKLSKNLEHVATAAERARDLVAQILTFSRQSERERKPQRLQIVAKEVLKLLRGSIPATVDIRQNIDTACSAVVADNTEVHQILMNLCTNAYHALPESGGVMNVSLSEVEIGVDEARTHPNCKPGNFVRLSVSDNGHGMDDATKTRIFEPYFTTKERGEGTGLGLATVHGIVQEMGGTIRVYSEKGQGTTFDIFFPAIETDVSEAKNRRSQLESLRGSERVLMIDDEVPIAHFVEAALTRLGYKVTVQTSSVDALNLFKTDSAAFDVVITDQMMPEMRGTELSKELNAIRSDIPIIMCSGFGDVFNLGTGQKVIRERVMKPVVIADLAAAIRKVVDKP